MTKELLNVKTGLVGKPSRENEHKFERERERKSTSLIIFHFKNDLLPRRINVYTKIISKFLIKIYLAYMHITQNLAWMMEQILVI